MFGIGPHEMIIVLIIGVLLFGKRLPEVGKSLGKGIVEFKKGMRGIEDELNSAVNSPSPSRTARVESDDYVEATAPKFVPPASEPKVESTQA
jgi:sec-independent protein translocase protein TatA